MNIAKIIEHMPSGRMMHSPLFGGLIFDKVDELNIIYTHKICGYDKIVLFDEFGSFIDEYKDKSISCQLFPSEKYDWNDVNSLLMSGDVVELNDTTILRVTDDVIRKLLSPIRRFTTIDDKSTLDFVVHFYQKILVKISGVWKTDMIAGIGRAFDNKNVITIESFRYNGKVYYSNKDQIIPYVGNESLVNMTQEPKYNYVLKIK